jgi:MoaA/NifB/PqqE/SkfB family radical SAM enzyme
MRPSSRLVRNFLENVLSDRISARGPLRPLIASYHVTWRCNLACSYCRFPVYASRAPADQPPELDTDGALRVLRLLAEGVGAIGFSGGEPLTRADLAVLLRACRKLGIGPRMVATNGLLLRGREDVLEEVDLLQISVDSASPEWQGGLAGLGRGVGRRILEAARWAGAQRERFGYRLVLNAVLAGQPLASVRPVETVASDIGASLRVTREAAPGGARIVPEREAETREYLRELQARRRAGDSVIESSVDELRVYETLRDFGCRPELNLRVEPDGSLPLPCHDLARTRFPLASAASWAELESAIAAWGLKGACPTPCFAPCHVTPTTDVRHPLGRLRAAGRSLLGGSRPLTARSSPPSPPNFARAAVMLFGRRGPASQDVIAGRAARSSRNFSSRGRERTASGARACA